MMATMRWAWNYRDESRRKVSGADGVQYFASLEAAIDKMTQRFWGGSKSYLRRNQAMHQMGMVFADGR